MVLTFFSFLCKFYITANNLKILGPRRGFKFKAAFILSPSFLECCLYKSTARPIPGFSSGEPAGSESELFKCKVVFCFVFPCLLSTESRQLKVLKIQPWIATRELLRTEYSLGSGHRLYSGQIPRRQEIDFYELRVLSFPESSFTILILYWNLIRETFTLS